MFSSLPIGIIIHHPIHFGYVYDLEVEEDHSFIAEGLVVHNCIGVPTVRGRARVVATGEAWFAALSADAQRAQAGDAAYDLLASGRAQLRDFVQPYTDRVFGAMQREASVKAILGRAS